jgi:hypothetical protein
MKKAISTLVLAAVLTLGSSFALAGDGIIVAGFSDNTCSQAANTKDGILVSDLDGIIVAGFTGIIVAGFTGIIVAGFAETKTEPTVNCGIIVAG